MMFFVKSAYIKYGSLGERFTKLKIVMIELQMLASLAVESIYGFVFKVFKRQRKVFTCSC